jgi:hypothetical protein
MLIVPLSLAHSLERPRLSQALKAVDMKCSFSASETPIENRC